MLKRQNVHIKVATALRPDFAIAHGNLASCFYDEGDLPGAIRQYKTCIAIGTQFP